MYLSTAIAEIENLIEECENDLTGGTNQSDLRMDQYEALKVAVNSMKSVYYAKQAMGIAFKGMG